MKAWPASAPGDTLYVRGGTYDEYLDNNAVSGASWDAPLSVKAYPGETVWMTPTSGTYIIYFADNQQYIEFDGINLDASVSGSSGVVNITAWSGGNAHHIRFKNAEVIGGADGVNNQNTGSGAFGFLLVNVSGVGAIGGNEFINLTIHGGGDSEDFAYAFYIQSSDNLVENCNIYDQAGIGIQIYNYYGPQPSNNVIRTSWIHDLTGSVRGYTSIGILVDGVDSQIYNNTISIPSGDQSAGIVVYGGNSTGNEIDNNTIYGDDDW